jgi:hypothetical protein
MKQWRRCLLAAVCGLALAGCAGPVIRSDVIAVHEWRSELAAQAFVFERSSGQNADLEYRTVENLVRTELQRVGLHEAAPAEQPQLTVKLEYGMESRDFRIIQPVVIDPFFYHRPLYWPRGRRFGYAPFYDPFWMDAPLVQYREGHRIAFSRDLHVQMAQAGDTKKLYDVTVHSVGGIGSLPAVMPYLVQSAFADFPGASGVPRRIEIEIKQ